MQIASNLETLNQSGLGMKELMEAVTDMEAWNRLTGVLAQAGMYKEGLHGYETQFNGKPVQPVVVWTNLGTPAEKAVTYFVPTAQSLLT